MLKDAPIGSPIFHIWNVLYLTIFSSIMAFGVLFVYYITYQPPNPLADVQLMLGDSLRLYNIEQKNMIKEETLALNIMDQTSINIYFETPELLRFYITDKVTGEPVMTVFSVSSGGFGGSVRALVGTDGNKVLAMRVLDVTTETAGLGQRVAEFGFQRQFINKTLDELPIDRTEWDSKGIDMISGATFSSSAIVDNIDKAFNLYQMGEN
ncbi:MAG: FMN-binding protein [Spirochaetota bacterium]|nr:FMN-binding protein [Spirochaetota bacterium]